MNESSQVVNIGFSCLHGPERGKTFRSFWAQLLWFSSQNPHPDAMPGSQEEEAEVLCGNLPCEASQPASGPLQSCNTLKCLPANTWDFQISQRLLSILEDKSFQAEGQAHFRSCLIIQTSPLEDLLDYRLWPARTS